MAVADRRVIEAGTPLEVLMDRAGRAVAGAVRRRLGGTYGRRVVVIAGKGNNGGDGIVAARHLEGAGVRTDVFELADERGFPRPAVARALARADVAVDAMYGTGFRGALDGDAAWVAETLAAVAVPVLAVDIPSGVDGLTGRAPGVAVRADATVTFAARKRGLLFEPGRTLAGEVTVADIGIPVGPGDVHVLDEQDVADALPARPPDAHKWHASLSVVAGSRGMTGAALLVGHAALRTGAGMVVLGLPGADAAGRASGSELVVRALPATSDGALDVNGAAEILSEVGRFKALAVGPGLGGAPATRIAVCTLVAEAAVPLVLDADGLNALAGDFSLLRSRLVPAVLTPHDGEYARLANRAVGPDRVEAAGWLAYETRTVVLLKGPGTVVAAPDGRVVVDTTGGPWLATAGSGDVLTGIIGALLARGLPAFEAAAVGAWLQGRAAHHAPSLVGLVASDLVTALPRTLAAVQG
jgi:NAD(P)H-hydrate epimerase